MGRNGFSVLRQAQDERVTDKSSLTLLYKRRELKRKRAGPARPAGDGRVDLQPDVHDARVGDDLLGRHPVPGGLRELPDAAHDRRPRHGVPADQRTVVLAAAALRDHRDPGVPARRSRPGRLDELQPAGPGQVLARPRHGPLDHRPAARRHQLDPGRRQLPRHHLQDAGAGDDALPDADLRLDDARHERARADGNAGPDSGADDALHRPQSRRKLLQHRRAGRQRDPLAERLLVLQPPGGLHHDPAGDGDRQRGPSHLQPEAALRLQGVRVRHGRHRRPRVLRVGPPHVHDRLGLPAVLQPDDVPDRGPDRREDVQLGRHDVPRQAVVLDGRCSSRSAS